MVYIAEKLLRVVFVLSASYFVVPVYNKDTTPFPIYTTVTTPRKPTEEELNCKKMLAKDICPNPNITYWLYAKNIHAKPYELVLKNITSIKLAPFSKCDDNPVEILLHGYNGDMHESPNGEIRPEYLFLDHDVISVNYPKLMKYPCLEQAVQNIQVIGRCLSKFIRKLMKTYTNDNVRKITKYNMHVIGFSLGAQIAAVAGNILRKGGTILPRITALDPLLPIYFSRRNFVNRRISSFVDVIHTNTKMRNRLQRLGHADFYVNDAIFYGNCDLDFDKCNTGMGPTYYADSINNRVALCAYHKNWTGNGAIMGEHIPFCTRGVFGVITSKFQHRGHGCKDCTSEPKYVNVFRMKDLTIKNAEERMQEER